MGEFLFSLMMGGCLLMYFVKKVVIAVDDDGEIKKTTCEGFASCIERLFKK